MVVRDARKPTWSVGDTSWLYLPSESRAGADAGGFDDAGFDLPSGLEGAADDLGAARGPIGAAGLSWGQSPADAFVGAVPANFASHGREFGRADLAPAAARGGLSNPAAPSSRGAASHPGRFGVDLSQSSAEAPALTANAQAFPVRASAISPATSGTAVQPSSLNAGNSTLSSAQVVDFTLGTNAPPVPLGAGFNYSLPSFLYGELGPLNPHGGSDGFSYGASFDVKGGIKGGVTVTDGSISPVFPLAINPNVLDYVQASDVNGNGVINTFSVKPTVEATDGAEFTLNLPTATANLSFGVTATAGAYIDFPSVTIGYSFLSYTIDGPSISKNVSGGKIISLPSSFTQDFPGGYASVSQIFASTQTSLPVSVTGDTVASVSQTFYTAPFLNLHFDAIAAIAQYVPELKELDGSENFGVGSASWSLLSLPMNAALKLGDTITTSELGFDDHLYETVGGVKHDLGTKTIGSEWDLQVPTYSGSGLGVIALEEDYKLTLNVHSQIGLFGSFNLTLDGPQGSGDIVGYDLSIGPVFSYSILSKSGSIASLGSTDTTVTLQATQRELVFYGTSAAVATVTQSQQTSLDLAASGAVLTINSGVYISPSFGSANGGIGVAATLGADGIYNYGSVYAETGPNSVGIDLVKGGKIVNGGDINADKGSHYRGRISYGVEIGGRYSTIVNTGTIGGAITAVADVATNYDFNLTLDNAAGADITGINSGVDSSSALILLHNDGAISGTGPRGIGVKAGTAGVFLNNSATGTITGTKYGVYSSGQGYINNQGLIGSGASAFGVRLGQGNVFNFGTIDGSLYGVSVGSPNLSVSSVYNAGLIEAPGHTAVYMDGKTNELSLKPGARFVGEVVASPSATSNFIDLLAGSGVGTLSTVGGGYQNFRQVDIADGASWVLQGGPTGFDGMTVAGLSSLDQISFRSTPFQYGDHAALNAKTGLLSVLNAGGTTLASINLQAGASLTGMRFNVAGDQNAIYIRDFTGAHFSDVIDRVFDGYTLSVPSQIIDSTSYFGPTAYGAGVTIAQNFGVDYNPSAYPSRKFGIELAPITVASTVVTNGTTSVTSVSQPQILHNHGFIEGYQEGVLLQTNGTILNNAQIASYKTTYKTYNGITSKYQTPFGDGVLQGAGSTYAKVVNYGSAGGDVGVIYAQNGVVVHTAAVIENLAQTDRIEGVNDGIISALNTTIQNAGSIVGQNGVGVALGHNSIVYNASGGLITGGADGISASGALDVVRNAGSIGGKVGVSFAKGGVVDNTYNLVGGAPVWGTITGVNYGVVAAGAAGHVSNGYGTVGAGSSPALIQGVLLSAGGFVDNGAYGDITNGAGGYGVVLAPAVAATISNAGRIGAIRAGRGDKIANAPSGTIQSIVGLGGASAQPLSIVNAGVIGAGAASLGVSTAVATYLESSGTIENGVKIWGGAFVDSGGVLATSSSANAVSFGTAAATLLLEAGAYFYGNVVGGAADTLELGASSSGFLSGLGSQIAGFGKNLVEAGAYWQLDGQNTLAGTWTVAGTLAQASNSELDVTGSVAVTGRVQGGAAGQTNGATAGLTVASGASLTNSGVIVGGRGSNMNSAGDGVDVLGGTVLNSGIIDGGNYQTGEFSPGYGGFGVYLGSGLLTNTGQIAGGLSQTGAYLPPGGVFIGSGATLVNSGTISGVSGAEAVEFRDNTGKLILKPGAAFNGVVAGQGGVLDLSGGANGVLTGLGTEFTNFAQVTEDAGASWTLTGANTIASAITLVSGATLTLAGSLTKTGGGPGVYLDGGVLVNATTLASSAVQFGPVPSSLGITPTASFTGVVTAPTGAGDTLLLEGANGTLSGLGTEYKNFGTLGVASGASWTMTPTSAFTGGVAVAGSLAFTGGGVQTIAGTLSGSGIIRLGVKTTLDLAGKGVISQAIGGVGTLEVQGALSLAGNGLNSGALDIVAGGTLAGAGAIGAAVVDNGSLNASGGTLTVSGAVSGAGALNVAQGSTLALAGGGAFGGTINGLGTIDFNAPMTLTSGAVLHVSNMVESASLTLGQGDSFVVAAGHAFDLLTSSAAPITLGAVGANTISNAGTILASGSGVATVQPRLVNTGLVSVNGGTLALTGQINNSGTLSVQAGALSVQQAVGGAGAMTVAAAGTLTLGGAVASGQTVDLAHGGLLDLGSPSGFQGQIKDFASSAGVDLLATAVTSDSYANYVLTLLNGSNVVGKLHFIGSYTQSSFQIGSDNKGGSLISSKA